MKNKFKISFFLIALMGLSMSFTSCVKGDFDVPPTIIPSFTLAEGDTLLTIAQLKAMHPLTIADSYDSIKNDYYIKGIVTANDETGNIYKSLYIQDATGAIVLSTDATDLYKSYEVGQVVYVKLKNLVYGFPWFGTPQLGGLFGAAPGRLSSTATPKHLFKDGLPGLAPVPAALNTEEDITLGKVSMLVRLDSVTFAEAGQAYVANNVSTNRNIILKDGFNLVLRNSSYATFKDAIMPSGKGSVIAIFSYYNGTYQLYLRDTNDVIGFTTGK